MPDTDLQHSARGTAWSPGRFALALACVAIALLIGALAIALRTPAPPRLSLVFVEYKDLATFSVRYAELRLTNGTTNTVEIPIVRDGPRPNTVLLLYRERLSGQWSQKKPEPECDGASFTYRELKPGQSFSFLAPVRPGAPPKQVGIGWLRPRRLLSYPTWRKWRYWSLRIRGLLHLKTPPMSPWDEIWCDKVLTVPGPDR